MGLNRQDYIFKYTVKPHNILKVGIALVESVYDLAEYSRATFAFFCGKEWPY